MAGFLPIPICPGLPGRTRLQIFRHDSRQGRPSCLDLLQFHVWDDSWADEKKFRETVTKLKSNRLVRAFGLSLNRWEPENGIRALRTGLVDTVQMIYNIFDQAPEDELFPVCRELNIGVIARVPLDEGGLSGKLTPETTFAKDDWRAGYFNPENLRATLERVERSECRPPGSFVPSRNGTPVHPFQSCGKHHDCRHAESGACPPEHGRE